MTESINNPITITPENYEIYQQRLQEQNISPEEEKNITRALSRFSSSYARELEQDII